jgi:hypothetical protein
MVVPVTFPARGSIGQGCALRALVAVTFFVVLALPFVESRATIAHDAGDISLFQTLAERCCKVTGVQADHSRSKAKPFQLTIQTLEVGLAVMHISCRGECISNDGVLAVNGSMIQVKESLWLLVASMAFYPMLRDRLEQRPQVAPDKPMEAR